MVAAQVLFKGFNSVQHDDYFPGVVLLSRFVLSVVSKKNQSPFSTCFDQAFI
jgi:hypothetical protein